MTSALQQVIDAAWEERDGLGIGTRGEVRDAVEAAIRLLDSGAARVAEKGAGRLDRQPVAEEGGPALLPAQPDGGDSRRPGRRALVGQGAVQIRRLGRATEFAARRLPRRARARSSGAAPSSAENAVLMPSFVNIGAYVGEGTMVDTWATVGSCAQIGRNVHISGGTGIGGVLEPLQAGPVIIEDDCFIGARSEVAEGVVVEQGAVISMGVFIGASTKIVDRATGEVIYGRVPAYSVVVPGTLPGKDGGPSLACAVIVKRVDAKTRSKTGINELLRD